MASTYKFCRCPTSPYTGSRHSSHQNGTNYISGCKRNIGEISTALFVFSVASNSDVCDVSLYWKHIYGDDKPEVVISHVLSLIKDKIPRLYQCFKDGLSTGVKI